MIKASADKDIEAYPGPVPSFPFGPVTAMTLPFISIRGFMGARKKQRILIVDDAAENIATLAALLKNEHMIIVAKDGAKALEKTLKNRPDIILLDIMMPGMDGYEVCRELKEREETKNIPVIFITSLSEPIDEAKAFNLGAVDYITKPFHPIVVKARVKNHLSLKMKNDMLEELIPLDGLTNIFNRRKFDETLEREWKRASRNNSPLSLILLDIDYFKLYNDNYGHARGDECLKKTAEGLKEVLSRPGDFLGRYGGEEFVIILPDTDLAGAEQTASRIQKMMADLNISHDFSMVSSRVTLSLGISAVPAAGGAGTPVDLIRSADQMLYKSKQNGRNRAHSCLLAAPRT